MVLLGLLQTVCVILCYCKKGIHRNTWGTIRGHMGYDQGTHGVRSGDTWGTIRGHMGYNQGTHGIRSGDTLGDQGTLGYDQGTRGVTKDQQTG